jgi:hypothetical protein
VYKIIWVEKGKECSEECVGFGEVRIVARTLKDQGMQTISIWKLEAVL